MGDLVVVAVFEDLQTARNAIIDLCEHGVSEASISVISFADFNSDYIEALQKQMPQVDAELFAESVRRGLTLIIISSPESSIYGVLERLDKNPLVDLGEKAKEWWEDGWLSQYSLLDAPIIRRLAGADGMNVIVNSGAAAGQDVFHYHVHVIPRTSDDGFAVTLPFPGSSPPDRTLLDAMAARIIAEQRDPARATRAAVAA